MNKLICLLGLLVLGNCLWTSSYWAKQGINVKDGVWEESAK